jgi:N utilization substance protein B
MAGNEPDAIRAHWTADQEFGQADRPFLDELWAGVNAGEDALLDELRPHLDRRANEVSPIERAILLVAAWELVNRLDTPYRVVINEAVELAKGFGGTEGFKYVNGVLDKLAGQLRSQETAGN